MGASRPGLPRQEMKATHSQLSEESVRYLGTSLLHQLQQAAIKEGTPRATRQACVQAARFWHVRHAENLSLRPPPGLGWCKSREVAMPNAACMMARPRNHSVGHRAGRWGLDKTKTVHVAQGCGAETRDACVPVAKCSTGRLDVV